LSIERCAAHKEISNEQAIPQLLDPAIGDTFHAGVFLRQQPSSGTDDSIGIDIVARMEAIHGRRRRDMVA
jgi:hypothetical protein